VLAFLGPPALLGAPGAQPDREATEAERERVRRAYWKALDEATDERDGTSGSKRSSPSSSGPAMRRPRDASRMISMLSLCICATRCATASAGAPRTCSSGRSAR